MKMYTGWQYLLIDAANHFGLDKLLFEERIKWAEEHLDELESLADQAESKPLYLKAVMAIRKAQKGIPTGHMVGFDSVCSGMQIMSALTGCHAGANATGLIDPNKRADAYTECTNIMRKYVPELPASERNTVKAAVMTVLYGSKEEPRKAFGDGTPELNAFYKAMYEMAPGACELLQVLLDSWRPYALVHQWTLPDNFLARVKVMRKVEDCRIEVDELNHTTFTYEYYVNEGVKKDRKNAANVIHSVDAYVLRSLIRRCNYDRELIEWTAHWIQRILLERNMGIDNANKDHEFSNDVQILVDRYKASQMPDIRILDYVQEADLYMLETKHLRQLARIVNMMLDHTPFEVIAVHDEFKCHANNMNWLRLHYREIMAELAESTILDDILSQIYGQHGTYTKKSYDLADKIRKSAYAIC